MKLSYVSQYRQLTGRKPFMGVPDHQKVERFLEKLEQVHSRDIEMMFSVYGEAAINKILLEFEKTVLPCDFPKHVESNCIGKDRHDLFNSLFLKLKQNLHKELLAERKHLTSNEWPSLQLKS